MPYPTVSTLGLNPSFGFGDRTGLATPGHVAAMQRDGGGILPIFPQQSIREMARTGRTPADVMQDALAGAAAAGWANITGADADHLKTPADVESTAAAGFVFFTIDPSGAVDQRADSYGEQDLREKFAAVRETAPWYEQYLGRSFRLPTGTMVTLDEPSCMRAAVKYGAAILQAIALSNHIRRVQESAGRDHEIELSVDETDQPTTLAEHWIIADQCRQANMRLVSLAPRFIGDFEKGVDFIGDLSALERSLADHAAIARLAGPYKLSLHSGSDKLSMYALLSRSTSGLFHVKTAGTSYLEALRVAAREDESLFRRIIDFARSVYDTDKATYHVSATLASAPVPSAVSSLRELEREYLELWDEVPEGRGFTRPGRQILHCTFGSTLRHPQLGAELRALLQANPETYSHVLADHFARHLRPLRAGL
ncbi:MAG: hypothetical protein RL215_1957 [Planctomycetota bacterium]